MQSSERHEKTATIDAGQTPIRRGRFGRTFWTLNAIEMWERLAFYNLRVMAPIYIMQADNPGGLHLSAADKGTIYAWWAVFQSLLPMVTGGLADRFGYKRTLGFALSLMLTGYVMMAVLRDLPWISNYWAFFLSIMTLATGTAFFKPSLQGSLAHQLTKETSSVGWGIFYWVVNVGAFIGPFMPSLLQALGGLFPAILGAEPHSKEAWRHLFLASALVTCFNFPLLLTIRDSPSGASQTEPIFGVLRRTFVNFFEPRLLCWILIMSCFCLMMYQLWDLQPNFIVDWVDSGPMAQSLERLPPVLRNALVEQTDRGPMIPQQLLLNFNAFFIIVGVVGVSWLTRRMRTLAAMLIGMVAVTAGLLVSGWTQNAWILVAGILCFSVGEMMTGPKNNEYLALIAPPGKKGLYLGYANIPMGLGVFVGSWLAGLIYGRFGEKAVLALRYLAEHTPFGADKNWSGDAATLEAALGVRRTEAMRKLQEATGLDPAAATQLLWDTYSPQYLWIPFVLIGIAATGALWIFTQRAKRWADMNA